MKVIRPIRLQDGASFNEMAFSASTGIRSLPKSSGLLRKKIEVSQKAFSQNDFPPYEYVFVLEDLETGRIEGTSGIKAKTGAPKPDYTYQIEMEDNSCRTEHVPKELGVMKVMINRRGPSEICGLYLRRSSRMSNYGKLLSYSRFLFMASFPERFENIVVAEMRGYFDKEGNNAFWDRFGRLFYDVPYHIAEENFIQETLNIPDILPKNPIYIDLLPRQVAKVMGKTHPNTKPALNLLLKNGFSLTNEIDILDGGPKIRAETKKIATIKNSQTAPLIATSDKLGKGLWIISNTSLDFRALAAPLKLTPEGAVIGRETAAALNAALGSSLRFVKI